MKYHTCKKNNSMKVYNKLNYNMQELVLEKLFKENVKKNKEDLFEELNEEFCTMAEELGDIGWDLEGEYKDLWQGSNNALQSKKYELEKVSDFSQWLKNFRIDPHR